VNIQGSYAVPSRCGDTAFAWTIQEPKSPYRASRISSGHSSGARTLGPHRPAAVSAPVGLHLKPGQKGTKRLVEQYGERLVCVRYRYDSERKKRFKTVELVVAESDWQPPYRPDEIVALRIDFTEISTRRRVKQAGGTWNPGRTVWQLRYDRVVALGLRRRIVTAQHPVLDATPSWERHPDPDAASTSR